MWPSMCWGMNHSSTVNKDGSVYKFKRGFYPLLISRNKKSVNQVDSLLIENSESESAEFLKVVS